MAQLNNWLTISRLNGGGNAEVTLTASPNEATEARNASIRIKTNTKTIILNASQREFEPMNPNNIPDNQLWMKSTYGSVIEPSRYSNEFKGKIISTELTLDGWTIFTFDEPLTIIEDSAFEQVNYIENIVFPKSLTTIGEYAFYNVIHLTSLTLPDSVITIGDWAFMNCTGLTSVNLGSVETISERAFNGCSALATLNLGNRVTTINKEAFQSCKALTTLVIPNSVTTIGEKAFYNCDSLETVIFPNSVTTIGGQVFASCDLLRVFNSSLATEDKRCLIINNKLVAFASAEIGTYVIPDGVTEIGDGAFMTSNITEITIPKGVTSIGNYTFYNCKSLSKIICKAQIAPLYYNNTFYGIKTNGVLEYPQGSNYSSWLTGGYNLGNYGWRGVPY